jgi:8-oxo-dGTP pyrophosphatase MutT (NUDIX family)
MVFDAAGRVLLIRCVVMRRDGEFQFWLTPGGEIEAGEEPHAAAVRELREELGLNVEVVGPVYTEATQFEHQGEMRDNLDFVFTARCAADAVVLRGVTAEEIEMMKEIRWWGRRRWRLRPRGYFRRIWRGGFPSGMTNKSVNGLAPIFETNE